MTNAYHLNCGVLTSPFIGPAICHCLLIQDNEKLLLIDTGFGALDILFPDRRIGNDLIEKFEIKLEAPLTATHQIEKLGLSPTQVTDIFLSHADFDHVGGLADFPHARVHLSLEEHKSISVNKRYIRTQFSHAPHFVTHRDSDREWNGYQVRTVYQSADVEILMFPLFGHTFGHCGFAIHANGKWILYAGDAYYRDGELTDDNHQATEVAQHAADDNGARMESISILRKLKTEQLDLQIFCYHDPYTFNNN
jgi:glyoxylase-like metal-dependent hydrolase (beta-lactamase superfamily II)